MADRCLRLRQRFAGIDALVPRVITLAVTSTSAVSEPRATATAATAFSGSHDDAAFGAYGPDGRCRGCCWCVCVCVSLAKTQRQKHENSHCLVCERIYLPDISLGLTFAGIDALKPPVIRVSVAGTSTILIPSAARSATTDSTGFVKRATLWARRPTVRDDG